jgi:hypothetical protein
MMTMVISGSDGVTFPDSTTQNTTDRYGFVNLIINGAMQVAQRGTSSTTSGYGTVDRFKVNYTGGTVTQSQESLSSGSPFDLGFHNFYRATNTSVATDTAAHFRVIRQSIEDQNVANSGWNYKSSSSYITLSFWVRSSVSQEFYAYTNQGQDAYNYAFSIGTLSANTWTKITKSIPGNSNLSFNNNNVTGIELNIVPFWGTNFTTLGSTTDSWYVWDGASRVPDMTSTWATTSGATFDITGVQLEVGSVATPFERRPFGAELALCQRYFVKTNPDNASRCGGFWGSLYTIGAAGLNGNLPVTMRAAPTLSRGGTNDDFYVNGINTNCTGSTSIFSATTTWYSLEAISLSPTGTAGFPIAYNGQASLSEEL